MLPASAPSPLCFCHCLCFYAICIVLEVFCAINLHRWDVSELASSLCSKLWQWIILTPPTVCFSCPSCPSSFLSPTVWTLGWQAPVGQHGDCKVGAQEESSSNLFQGETGSVGVEVHQAARSQYDAFSSLSLLEGESWAAAMPFLKPKHLWKAVWNVSQIDWLSSRNNNTALPLLSSSTEKWSALH